MAEHTGGLFAGPSDGLVSWLTWGAVGPAAVALPVNWAAAKLADAAVREFKRLRQTDDLSRLVKAAGTSVQLSRAEINAVRGLLGDEETWHQLGKGDVTQLSDQIAERLPPRDGRTAEDSRKVAGVIARGLLEFAVFELERKTFQKVVLVRLGQMADQVTALNEALFRAHKHLYHGVDDAGAKDLFKLVMDRLPPGPADLNEVKIYLKTLIDWLNSDPWPRDNRIGPELTPAAIERKLQVRAASPGHEHDIDADELGRQCSRLVILGGPGSGKTWLAKRTARICAEEALKELDEATLDDVELPLYTTCSRLVERHGGIREAAVSSAIERIGDLGGTRIIEALRLFFTSRDRRTLLIIDSLDEADADKARDRLREADSFQHPWRVVLTSRPSSWMNQLNIREGNQDQQVGELQPLRYPGDVEDVIQRWFDYNRKRGQDLVEQIAGRPSLQQAATVPLILAFYCILGGSQPLPEFRHDLYQKIIDYMLHAPWRSNKRPFVDKYVCRDALRNWARQGATKNHQVSGVGQWEDDIPTEQVRLSPDDRVAVDHVAVPRGQPDLLADVTSRRFVHRSIREYLVADYVADLPVNEAVTALRPHLWYDPDWEYTAPAAIAMHARRARQARQANHDGVLRALLCRAVSDEIPGDLSAVDLSAVDAGGEVRKLLARIAAESREDDWSPEVAGIIGQARVELAQSGSVDDFHGDEFDKIALGRREGMIQPGVLGDLGDAIHWPASNHQVREALLEHLDGNVGGWEAARLADTLIKLDPEPDKHRARKALLARLADEPHPRELASALVQRDPTPAEKLQAIVDALARLLADNDGRSGSSSVAHELAQLAQTPEEKRQTRRLVLGLLTSDIDALTAVRLAGTLARLDPTPDDKSKARLKLLDLLAGQASGTVTAEPGTLVAQLDPELDDEREVHYAVLTLIANISAAATASKVAALVAQLNPEPNDKRRALDAVLTLLTSQTSGLTHADLVATVLQLDPEPGDKSKARRVLLARLTSYANGALTAYEAVLWELANKVKERQGSFPAAELAALVVQLDPEPGDQRQALNAVLTVLELDDQVNDEVAVSLAALAVQLNPTPGDKRRALDAVLTRLGGQVTDAVTEDQAMTWQPANRIKDPLDAVAHLVVASVFELYSLSDDDTVAMVKSHTEGWSADRLADTLIQLDAEPSDKQQAINALLGRLTRIVGGWNAYWEALRRADELIRLDATGEGKRRACEALLGQLSGRPELVSVVVRLASTPYDKREVLRELLSLLDHETDSAVAGQLIDGMAQLDPTVHDLNSSCRWAAPPTGQLLAAARRNSSLDEWLEVLPSLNRVPGHQPARRITGRGAPN